MSSDNNSTFKDKSNENKMLMTEALQYSNLQLLIPNCNLSPLG